MVVGSHIYVLLLLKLSSGIFVISASDHGPYRLPSNSIPLRYDLLMKTDIDRGLFNFSGKVKIQSKIIEQSESITIHSRGNFIEEISLTSEEDEAFNTKLNFKFHEKYDFLEIFFPSPFNVGKLVNLEILYQGVLRDDRKGFYRASYIDDHAQKIWYAATMAQRLDARHIMPCYDEPGLKAIFGVSIEHRADFHAVANMPALSHERKSGSSSVVTTKFQDTPRMSSYVLGFLVSNMTYVTKKINNFEQRIFANPRLLKNFNVSSFFDITEQIVQKLEDYLEIPFPLPKLDHVFVDMKSAMENFGLITYSESKLLDAPQPNPEFVETIAHEIAHQYFGNLVTPSWWSYAWLSEGFASLMDHLIPSLIWKDENHWVDNFNEKREEMFAIDIITNEEVKPLNFEVETPEEIHAKFDLISYEKGACVLKMFENALGPTTFQKALKYFLRKFNLQSSTPDDLNKSFQKAFDKDFPENGINIGKVMSEWENRIGYPVIYVEKTVGKFLLTQRHENDENFTIPISYATEKIPNFDKNISKIWMKEKTVEIDGGDWIIVNVGLTGYYRVVYDFEAKRGIVEAIKKNRTSLPSDHRAQLFRNLLDDMKNGIFNFSEILDIMSIMRNETNTQVWKKFVKAEEIFRQQLFGTSAVNSYFDFIKWIIAPRLKIFEPTSEEFEKLNEIEKIIFDLSCEVMHRPCLKLYTKIFTKKPEGDFDSQKLCYSLRLANFTIYSKIIDRLTSSDDEKERYSLSTSIGCSLDKKVLRKVLNLTLSTSKNLTTTEKLNLMFSTLESSEEGLEAVLDFILLQYQGINKSFPGIFESFFDDLKIRGPKHHLTLKLILKKLVNEKIINLEDTERAWKSLTDDAWSDADLKTLENLRKKFF